MKVLIALLLSFAASFTAKAAVTIDNYGTSASSESLMWCENTSVANIFEAYRLALKNIEIVKARLSAIDPQSSDAAALRALLPILEASVVTARDRAMRIEQEFQLSSQNMIYANLSVSQEYQIPADKFKNLSGVNVISINPSEPEGAVVRVRPAIAHIEIVGSYLFCSEYLKANRNLEATIRALVNNLFVP